jgi:hypothetical protein
MGSYAVRKVLLMVALAFTLPTTFHAATKRDFQTGELLSVTSGKGLDEVATHRWAIFTVQVGDVIYTASGGRIHHRTDDYQEGLTVGDPIHVAISGNDLILLKPNGKELKTKIIKRARAQ